jgi:hypothetical protein
MSLPDELKALLATTVSLKRDETERERLKKQQEQEARTRVEQAGQQARRAASADYEALWAFSQTPEVEELRTALRQLQLQELVLEGWGTRAVVLRARGAPLGVRRYGNFVGMLDPSVRTLAELVEGVPPEVATRLAEAVHSGSIWAQVYAAVEAHRRVLTRRELPQE